MTTPKHTAAAPSLPPASVDFNKLHEACKAGKAPDKALEASVIVPPKPAKAAEPTPKPAQA